MSPRALQALLVGGVLLAACSSPARQSTTSSLSAQAGSTRPAVPTPPGVEAPTAPATRPAPSSPVRPSPTRASSSTRGAPAGLVTRCTAAGLAISTGPGSDRPRSPGDRHRLPQHRPHSVHAAGLPRSAPRTAGTGWRGRCSQSARLPRRPATRAAGAVSRGTGPRWCRFRSRRGHRGSALPGHELPVVLLQPGHRARLAHLDPRATVRSRVHHAAGPPRGTWPPWGPLTVRQAHVGHERSTDGLARGTTAAGRSQAGTGVLAVSDDVDEHPAE